MDRSECDVIRWVWKWVRVKRAHAQWTTRREPKNTFLELLLYSDSIYGRHRTRLSVRTRRLVNAIFSWASYFYFVLGSWTASLVSLRPRSLIVMTLLLVHNVWHQISLRLDTRTPKSPTFTTKIPVWQALGAGRLGTYAEEQILKLKGAYRII